MTTNKKHVLRPILRGAWVQPLKDGACHDEHLQQLLEEKVVLAAALAFVPYGIVLVRAAAAVMVVVVVVRGGKHAFGAHTFSTYYAHN